MDEARDGPSISDLSPDLIETLEELRRRLVCFLGINTFDEEVARASLPIPAFDSFMIEYNVLKKHNATLIDDIAARRAVLIGTP